MKIFNKQIGSTTISTIAAILGGGALAHAQAWDLEAKFVGNAQNGTLGTDVDFSHNTNYAIAGVADNHSVLKRDTTTDDWSAEPAELNATGTGVPGSVTVANAGHAAVGISKFSGGVHFLQRIDDEWPEEAYFTGRGLNSALGYSVDNYNLTTVAGLPGAFSGRGQVWIFTKGSGAWELTTTITSPVLSADRFGTSVAFTKKILAVGAPYDSTEGDLGGAVHIYVRNGSNWTREAVLRPHESAENGQLFGTHVDLGLGSNGTINLIVGGNHAIGNHDVYIFERDRNGSWDDGQPVRLDSSGRETTTSQNVLRGGVGIGENYAAVGAKYNGSVFVLAKGESGWDYEQTLGGDVVAERFGSAVEVEGERVIVGAPENSQAVSNGGAVYIFRR